MDIYNRIKEIIKSNAFMIEMLEGNIVGIFNSRQLKSHREPQYKPQKNSSDREQKIFKKEEDLESEIRMNLTHH